MGADFVDFDRLRPESQETSRCTYNLSKNLFMFVHTDAFFSSVNGLVV